MEIGDLQPGQWFIIVGAQSKYAHLYARTTLRLDDIQGIGSSGLAMAARVTIAHDNSDELVEFWKAKSGDAVDWKFMTNWGVELMGPNPCEEVTKVRVCTLDGTPLEWVALAERCPKCWKVYT